MKKLFLHIGTPKTGSTSLQMFLGQNREHLGRLGIYYPDVIDKEGYEGNGEEGNGYPLYNGSEADEARAFKKLDEMFQLYDTVLLSSEVFWSTNRLKEKLEGLVSFGADVTVIVYIRRQDEYLNSLYNQVIKGDCTFHYNGRWKENYLEWMHADYDNELAKIEDVIGKDHIIVRIFDKTLLTGHDICIDFLSLLGISEKDTSLFCRIEEQNISLSDSCRNLKNIFNAALKNEIEAWPDKKHFLIHEALLMVEKQIKRKRSNIFSAAERKEILAEFFVGNSRLAMRYFGRDRLFDIDEKEFDDDGSRVNRDIDMEAFIQLFASYYLLNERRAEWRGRQVDNIERTIQELSIKVATVDNIERTIQELSSKAAAYDTLVNSRSWQLTAPLRAVGGFLRGLFKKG